MNELPKVYVNPIKENINNSQERTTITNNNIIDLNSILTKDKYPFNHIYEIILKDNKKIVSSIIKITHTNILTIDGDIINIKDIINLQEIKK